MIKYAYILLLTPVIAYAGIRQGGTSDDNIRFGSTTYEETKQEQPSSSSKPKAKSKEKFYNYNEPSMEFVIPKELSDKGWAVVEKMRAEKEKDRIRRAELLAKRQDEAVRPKQKMFPKDESAAADFMIFLDYIPLEPEIVSKIAESTFLENVNKEYYWEPLEKAYYSADYVKDISQLEAIDKYYEVINNVFVDDINQRNAKKHGFTGKSGIILYPKDPEEKVQRYDLTASDLNRFINDVKTLIGRAAPKYYQ